MAIPVNAKPGTPANWSRKKVPTGWTMVKENCFQNIHLIMKNYYDRETTVHAAKMLLERVESGEYKG